MHLIRGRVFPILLMTAGIGLSIGSSIIADDTKTGSREDAIRLTSPALMQVIQRSGFHAAGFAANPKAPNARGIAHVKISGSLPESAGNDPLLQYRIVNADRKEIESTSNDGWAELSHLNRSSDHRNFDVSVSVPAGGWYRLEVRTAPDSNSRPLVGVVERFGVGEVFLIAGQSYATNTNDERLKIHDPTQRVSALNTETGQWGIAHDPQPAPDKSDGGSIWPAFGDALCAELQVPVGFANVAFGGTSSAQWLPDGKLHDGLIHGGRQLGRFRAVLWQQGESDVIAKTTIETYLANLTLIRDTAVREWGFEPVWLAAKSTHHPTVYNDPEGECRIRAAIERLTKMPGFGAGPDTDVLQGDNRGDRKSRRHFSAAGQRRAADLWVKTVLQQLEQQDASVPASGVQ